VDHFREKIASLGTRKRWFEPPEALKTVRGLIAHIEAHPEIIEGDPGLEGALWDLRSFGRALEAASVAGKRFHFWVG
jgi:hypothetical protein